MTIRPLLCLAVLSLAAAISLSGCATTEGMSQDAVRKEVKGLTPTTFAQPFPRVYDVALRALTSVGCDVEEKQKYLVAGSRPRHMGLIVGSGGETVTVYMLPESDTSTQVWVNTDKTFLGIAGQRNWSERTIDEMKTLLSSPAPARPR